MMDRNYVTWTLAAILTRIIIICTLERHSASSLRMLLAVYVCHVTLTSHVVTVPQESPTLFEVVLGRAMFVEMSTTSTDLIFVLRSDHSVESRREHLLIPGVNARAYNQISLST